MGNAGVLLSVAGPAHEIARRQSETVSGMKVLCFFPNRRSGWTVRSARRPLVANLAHVLDL